jgi:hypothetical protein
MKQNVYDVAIVCWRPADLNAALILARSRRSVAVRDMGAPAIMPHAWLMGILGSKAFRRQKFEHAERSSVNHMALPS